jgi:enamine deaminase RidA (YjgF/YER057c/UK114 family)
VSEKRFLSLEALPPPFGYSHVVEASGARTLYLSGQVPLDRDGGLEPALPRRDPDRGRRDSRSSSRGARSG